MPTWRIIPREEAQIMAAPKLPGPRRQRMDEFDSYVNALVSYPDEALVIEDIGEPGQKFVLSLRGALTRAHLTAVVRKVRGRDEVRVWLTTPLDDEAKPKTRGRPKKELISV